jgi:pSer/pThr/pTyr-binding forkhead associated (FHA) protein
MAELKTCTGCGYEIPATTTMVCPECWNDPDQLERRPDPAAEDPVPAAPVTQVEIAVAGVRFRVAADESVLLGRQGDARAAAALARFDNVSRRHATIRVLTNGSVEACDVDSRNGTFIGELRLEPRTPVTLPLPSTVRLGRCCFVELRAAP